MLGVGGIEDIAMWIIQIIVGVFWLLVGIALLFREITVWNTVDDMVWFKNRYHNAHTYQWKRFCRHAGIVCFATGCLLFLKLPFGLGVFGALSLGLMFPIAFKWLRR